MSIPFALYRKGNERPFELYSGTPLACITLEKMALALSIYTILNTLLNYVFLGSYYALVNFLLSATFLVVFTTVLGILEVLKK